MGKVTNCFELFSIDMIDIILEATGDYFHLPSGVL